MGGVLTAVKRTTLYVDASQDNKGVGKNVRSGRRPETRHGGGGSSTGFEAGIRHTFYGQSMPFAHMNAANGTFTEPAAHSGPPRRTAGRFFYFAADRLQPGFGDDWRGRLTKDRMSCTSRLRFFGASHNAGGKKVPLAELRRRRADVVDTGDRAPVHSPVAGSSSASPRVTTVLHPFAQDAFALRQHLLGDTQLLHPGLRSRCRWRFRRVGDGFGIIEQRLLEFGTVLMSGLWAPLFTAKPMVERTRSRGCRPPPCPS